MLSEQPMYAYEISKKIKERFGFSTATVTIYVVLYKMQREGLIKISEEISSHGKPTRKYYEITAEGKKTFLQGKTFIEEMVRSLQ